MSACPIRRQDQAHAVLLLVGCNGLPLQKSQPLPIRGKGARIVKVANSRKKIPRENKVRCRIHPRVTNGPNHCLQSQVVQRQNVHIIHGPPNAENRSIFILEGAVPRQVRDGKDLSNQGSSTISPQLCCFSSQHTAKAASWETTRHSQRGRSRRD